MTEMHRFRHRRAARSACVLLLAILLSASSALAQTSAGAQPSAPATSKFTSPDDGWFDMGGFLDARFGFMPVATVITEPAVGLGAAGGVAFIEKPPPEGRPDITVGVGLGTSNGSKGAMVGDLHHWFDQRVQTVAAAFFASINLDYYGLGDDSVLAGNPLRYNLEPVGAMGQVKYRVSRSPFWAGLRYVYARTDVAFDAPAGTPGLPDIDHRSTEAHLAPSMTFDTRDNLFTPTRGSYVEGTVSFFSDVFGGDDDFQETQVIGLYYLPLPAQVFLGVRGELSTSSDGTPFYLRPFIYQRGVPAMRYQGEEMAQIEGEVRWQFWKRFSLVGFGGTGAVWTGFEQLDRSRTTGAGGGGFRYELARSYGIHAGFDVAWGPDGPAYYVQMGSAWARP